MFCAVSCIISAVPLCLVLIKPEGQTQRKYGKEQRDDKEEKNLRFPFGNGKGNRKQLFVKYLCMVFVFYDCFVYHLFFLSLSLNVSLSLHLSTPPSQDPPLAEKALERGSPARLHLQHLQCYITMKYSKESQHVSTSKPRHRQHRPPLSVTYNYLVKHKSTNPAQTQHNLVGSVIPQGDLVEYMGYTETIY